jgi:molybdopterin synthase sulfur carrier subunit
MKISVLFFGLSHDIAGKRSEELELPAESSVGDLRRLLESKYAGLNTALAYAIAVNETFSSDNQPLKDGDIAAILPPVSGG